MKWLAAIAVGLGALIVPKTITTEPRGIRNNNPGNVRYDGVTPWRGMVGVDNAGFIVFERPEYGIRAMARILTNYSQVHGLNTVAGIINRWAPSSENDTGAYVEHVARVLGVAPDQTIDVQARMAELIAVIIRHENGEQPYTVAQLGQGIAWA